MKIPVEPGHTVRAESTARPEADERGFCIVGASPSERFVRRAEAIADAAEDGRLQRDTVPFGLRRRVVLRVPVFGAEDVRDPSASGNEAAELFRARRLLARVALDLVSEVMKINHHFAEAGLLGVAEPDPSKGRGGRRG